MTVKVWRRAVLVIAFCGLSMGVVACGDDDDDDAGGGVAAYCDYSAGLDEGDDLPSDDELDRLAELAPSDISEEVDLVVARIKDEGEAVFADEDDEEFFSALEDIEAFEEQTCGREDADG